MAFVYLDASVLVAIALGDPRGVKALAIEVHVIRARVQFRQSNAKLGYRFSTWRLLEGSPQLSPRP